MQSSSSPQKSPKGSVQVLVSNGRLQLRFRYGGKRHYLSMGLPDTPTNRVAAEAKANQIYLDIVSGNFDATLKKYQPATQGIQHPDLFCRYQREMSRELYEAIDRLESLQQQRSSQGSIGSFRSENF